MMSSIIRYGSILGFLFEFVFAFFQDVLEVDAFVGVDFEHHVDERSERL